MRSRERKKEGEMGTGVLIGVFALVAWVMIRLAYERARSEDMMYICLPLNLAHLLAITMLVFGLTRPAVITIISGIAYAVGASFYVYLTDPAKRKGRRGGRIRRYSRAFLASVSSLAIAAWIGWFLHGDLFGGPIAVIIALGIIISLWWSVAQKIREKKDEGPSALGTN